MEELFLHPLSSSPSYCKKDPNKRAEFMILPQSITKKKKVSKRGQSPLLLTAAGHLERRTHEYTDIYITKRMRGGEGKERRRREEKRGREGEREGERGGRGRQVGWVHG